MVFRKLPGIKGVGPKMLEKTDNSEDGEVDSETQALNKDIKTSEDLLRITEGTCSKDLAAKGYTERISDEYALENWMNRYSHITF